VIAVPGVSHHLADDLHRLLVRQLQRGERVPQVVEPDARKAGGEQHPLEVSADEVIGRHVLPALWRAGCDRQRARPSPRRPAGVAPQRADRLVAPCEAEGSSVRRLGIASGPPLAKHDKRASRPACYSTWAQNGEPLGGVGDLGQQIDRPPDRLPDRANQALRAPRPALWAVEHEVHQFDPSATSGSQAGQHVAITRGQGGAMAVVAAEQLRCARRGRQGRQLVQHHRRSAHRSSVRVRIASRSSRRTSVDRPNRRARAGGYACGYGCGYAADVAAPTLCMGASCTDSARHDCRRVRRRRGVDLAWVGLANAKGLGR
jgi:hypothetical protein